jgi:hypothetical protein
MPEAKIVFTAATVCFMIVKKGIGHPAILCSGLSACPPERRRLERGGFSAFTFLQFPKN